MKSCCTKGMRFQLCKMNEFQTSAVPYCAKVNTASYTESFKRAALSSLGLETGWLRAGSEGSVSCPWLPSRVLIFFSFISHISFIKMFSFFKIFFWCGSFLSLYWICYNTASVLCFGFLVIRHVGILAPPPGIEPTAAALECEVVTTGPPRKSHKIVF